MQGDGRILRGDDFATVGATTRNRFSRLNTNGSLETSFDPNVNGNVLGLAVQADGKIIFNGAFTTAGVSNRNRIARLNGDGSLDTNFNPNVSSTVQGVAVQADGLILLGGNFTSVGGLNLTNVARLQNDAATKSLAAPTANRIECCGAERHRRRRRSAVVFRLTVASTGSPLVARAGYQPEVAVAFWERFSAFNKSRGASETPWYLRTHPLDEKRIAALKAELPAARKQFKPQ